jgi:hypothetical protein
MITLKSVRIGNFVKCKVSNDAGVYQILQLNGWNDKIMLDGVRRESWYDTEKILPIKITKEWLIKFWFKELNNGFKKHKVLISLNSNGLHDLYIDSNYWGNVKYVHVLQNLCFAINGAELILN